MPVPDFAVGEVLTSAAMDSIGLWLVKTQTVGTAVSSVTVSNAFSADFNNYVVTYSGGEGSTTANINLRFGSTNTGYYAQLIYAQYGATSALALVPDNNAGQFSRVGTANTTFAHINIAITTPFLTNRTFVSSQWTGAIQSGNYQGFLDNATSYTAFDIFPSGGTLTGGTIRVYGYRN
jgi:hypothetical protein